MTAEPRWLSANDAAAYLNISTEGFRRKVRDGVIPPPSRADFSACFDEYW